MLLRGTGEALAGFKNLEKPSLFRVLILSLGGLLLGVMVLGVGCRSSQRALGLLDLETGESLLAIEPVLDMRAPGLTLAESRTIACMNKVCAPQFRVRALAQKSLICQGPGVLPYLVRGYQAAKKNSRMRSTLRLLIRLIQKGQTRRDLARELTETQGIRQIEAVRAASTLGAPLVPTLLPLLTHRNAAVRREVVIALRTITGRHPIRTGLGPVQATHVWRTWYESECDRLKKSGEMTPGFPVKPGQQKPGVSLSM